MQELCLVSDLIPNSGVCALYEAPGAAQQIALFYLPAEEQQVFAVSNWDPIGKANVISRGIVGSIGGAKVIASPLYKQHFDLETGQCLEDESVALRVYPVALENDRVVLLD